MNPIANNQRRANAYVADMNKIQSNLLLTNKELIPYFEREKCFYQDESYIFVCQATNITSAFPTAFNYAISRRSNLKSYVGGVFIVKVVKNKKTAQSLVCEAKASGTQLMSRPTDAQTCSSESIRVKEQFIP